MEGFLARTEGNERTIAAYRDELLRFERRVGSPLGSAPTRALEKLKAELRTTKGYRTRARLLRQFYHAAGLEDAAAIFKPKRSDARQARISPAEILTLPEVNDMLRAARSLRDRAFIATLWETGARVSEVLDLDVADVRELASRENGGREIVTVFFRRVKIQGQEHSSYLLEGGEHVRAWLTAYKPDREDVALFPSGRGGPGSRLTRDGAERLVRRTAARAGLKKRVYCHLFRHSRTTHLLRIGVAQLQVANLLGWKSTRMLERYSHLVDRDAYAALLRAHGLEPPEPATHETLLAAEGELRPVVPIVPAPHPEISPLELEIRKRLATMAAAMLEAAKTDPIFQRYLLSGVKNENGERIL